MGEPSTDVVAGNVIPNIYKKKYVYKCKTYLFMYLTVRKYTVIQEHQNTISLL